MSLKIILILGPPSHSGRELGEKLSAGLGIPFVHFADFFRKEMRKGSEAGKKIKLLVQERPLSNAFVNELLLSKFPKQGFSGFILQGYPRNTVQLVSLLQLYQLNALELVGIHLTESVPTPITKEMQERITQHQLLAKSFADYLLANGRILQIDAQYELQHVINNLSASPPF